MSLSPPSPRTGRLGRWAFLFIIVTVFIDILAFAVIIPSTPFLMSELTGLPLQEVTPWGGYLTAVYAVMNFITQPILGNLSDRYGRRPVLLISMGMLSVDFLIMGFAHSLWLLFIGRILSGLSGATHSTAAAYIADTTEAGERAQAFGMLGAAFGLGFILGPVIGGFLTTLDPRAPFFAAAALAGINFIYGSLVLPESLSQENRRPFEWKRANALGSFRHFARLPRLAWFILTLGVYNFAHWVYPATFSYFGPIRYGWDAHMTGLALGAVGVGAAVVQGALCGRIIRLLGEEKTALLGILSTVCAMTGYAFASEGWMIFLIIPLGALGGLMGPSMNQIMTARVEKNAQGELQGALASIQAAGNIVAPIVMTQVLFAFTGESAMIYFPGAAFLLAAVLTAASLLPFRKAIEADRANAALVAEKTS